MQLKVILVPYDFSEYAEHAFRWALGIAEDWGAKIVLVHVIPLTSRVSYPDAMFLLDIPKLEAQLIADAEKHLSAFVAKEGTSVVPVETRTIMGDPFWEICQTAEREHTDLIVIGSHGRTGLAHVLLGSVAERGWSVTHPVPSSLPGAGLHNEGRRRPRKEVADSVEQQGLHLSGSHHRHHTEVGYD